MPSLRWSQMVVWRHDVAKDCLTQLAFNGLLCPKGTLDAVKNTALRFPCCSMRLDLEQRLRFLLELPLNTHAVSLIQPQAYFTPTILENLTHFFLKIDMALTDPAHAPYLDNHRNPSLHPAITCERRAFRRCFTKAATSGEKPYAALVCPRGVGVGILLKDVRRV